MHNLALALTERGHQVHVVTPRTDLETSDSTYPYSVHRFGFKGYGRLHLVDTMAVAKIASVALRYSIDVVHAHNLIAPSTWVRCYRRLGGRARLIGTPHGNDVLLDTSTGWGARNDPEVDRAVRRNISAMDLLTAISPPIFDELLKLGAQESAVRIVPNGIWPEECPEGRPDAVRKALGVGSSTALMVSVGRNHPVKGFRNALRSVARLRQQGLDIAYLLVGREGESILSEAKALGIDDVVFVVGEIKPEAVAEYLQAADVILVPSVVESFSITALEGMRAGKPCVLSTGAGVSGMLAEGSCLRVPAHDDDALDAALRSLVNNVELRTRVGARGAEEVRKFYWPVIAARYESVYREALARNGC
ncbi:MAG: glycosyltransferase family 4 protein [Pseudomonadales bacterium]|nr:glycosyltransferase family 4 protein [Pseudomonadales bacterium]MCP5183576.1 glycosyltransferase family 4 protein [Pseudomonadales bacterium]